MSTPSRIYDGDLTQATQDGPGWFTRPFQDQGDTQSWEWHAWFTQRADYYTGFSNTRSYYPGFVPNVEQMYSTVTSKGVGYLVHEDEPSEVNNTGWLRFKRTYAGLPATRYEGCEIAYAFQLQSTSASYTWTTPPAQPEVAEWPMTLAGYRKYEYFISQWPAVLIAPKVTAINYTFLYLPFQSVTADDGGFPPTYTTPWIARDSTIRIVNHRNQPRVSAAPLPVASLRFRFVVVARGSRHHLSSGWNAQSER